MTSAPDRVPWPDRLLFFVLTAVLGARPLISESFQRTGLSFLPSEAGAGTTPATAVWLDGILLIAAVVVGIRYWRSAVRVSLVNFGLVSLLAAVVISVAAAGEKRVAANAGANLFVMALAGVALLRVLRARWMVHLLIAALLAAGVTNAVKCATQRAWEFDDTLQYWQQQKPVREAAGIDPDSPAIINYERRLRSNEAFGFLAHSNVAAACLTMCLLVAAGLFVGVLRRRGMDLNRKSAEALLAITLAGTLAVGLWLTTSVGAIVASVVAGVLLLALGAAPTRIARRTGAILAILVAGYVAVVAAGAAYGLTKGTLPHTSLAFRWEYWRAAGQAIGDAPLTGIGRENFRAAYLLNKSVESTEEVGNPHNVWLSLLVELGPLGLLAGVVLIGSAVFGTLRGLRGNEHGSSPRCDAGSIVIVGIGLLLVQGVASGTQFGAQGIPVLWAVFVAGVWWLAFLIAYRLLSDIDGEANASAWLGAGLCAALCATTVHNLIGFSLITPAGLSVFVGLAAGGTARFSPPAHPESGKTARPPQTRTWIIAATCVGSALVLVYTWGVALPTTLTQRALQRLEIGLQRARDETAAYEAVCGIARALETDSWDSELPRHAAAIALQIGADSELPAARRAAWLRQAEEYVDLAAQRNANEFATRRLLASVLQAKSRFENDRMPLPLQVAEAWDRAVELYPTDPRTRIEAGSAWFDLWKKTGAARGGQRAAEHLREALKIDAKRLPEVAVKLRAKELGQIQVRLDALRAAGIGSAP